MPKQIYNNTDFSGGINGIDSPRDVVDTQVIKAKGVTFDEKGRIRMMGDSVKRIEIQNDSFDASAFESGTSLFYFTHDYNMLKSGPALDDTPTAAAGEFFALANQEHIAIYDFTVGLWLLTAIDMGADPTAGERIVKYYFADAALRCYNPTFNANVFPRWHGHIKRTLFEGSTAEIVHNEWYTTTTKLMAPEGNVAYDATIGAENPGVNTWTNDGTADVARTTATHFTINMTAHADGGVGTWIAGTYTFHLSYIYDGSQESPVGTGPGSGTAGDANSSYYNLAIGADATLWIGCQYYSGATFDHNKRITGARLYYSDPVDGDGIKYHLMDIDFSKGCRKFNETDYTKWDEEGSTGGDYQCPVGLLNSANIFEVAGAFEFEDMPKSVTYEMLNGYGSTEITDAQFKCHTIFNNRAYVGNIKQDGKTYGDRLIRSPINFEGNPQYDTFPATHKMEVAANDGDDITALEGFGDRLLIFKKQSVYVINVAQDGTEFVETKFSDLGVLNSSQVTVTEYGIIWINSSGCYLYTGKEQPVDLITNRFSSFKGRVITPNMKWSVAEDKYPSIAFMPRHNKILISMGLEAGYSNHGYIYDFVKKAWSFGGGVIARYQYPRSNFVVDNKGVPHFAELKTQEMEIYRWEDVSQPHSEFSIWFKDVDFEQPNVRKKFYKAYLQFRASSTTNVTAYFTTNGNYGQQLAFADGTGIESNVLTFSATYANLVANGDFQTTSGRVLEDNDDGTELDSTGWYTKEENAGGNIMIDSGVMTWENDADSDLMPYTSIDVASGTTYQVSFTALTSSMEIGNVTTVPRIMCMISKADGEQTIADVEYTFLAGEDAPDENEAFKVSSWSGTYTTNFTADASQLFYIAFRAVVLTTGADPDLFVSWVAADANVAINQCQVSNVSVRQLDEWRRAELKPNTSSQGNNIYSVGVRLDVASGQTVPSDFEIDNLSLVYRTKNIK